jgi:hypothetical protein
MSEVKKMIDAANRFADKAINDAGTRTPRGVKDWLLCPVVLRRVELVVLIGLVGWFVTYELGMYING